MEILIVDDEELYGQLFLERIIRMGYQADYVSNGRDALRRLRKRNFDLIMLDVFLQDELGHRLIPEIRHILPHIDIIMMTGKDSRELELELNDLGACYMPKPINFHELKRFLDHQRKIKYF